MVLFCAAIKRGSVSPMKFSFLAMSRYSRGQSRQFIAWSFYTVVFLPIIIIIIHLASFPREY